jgi:hypothetical protein
LHAALSAAQSVAAPSGQARRVGGTTAQLSREADSSLAAASSRQGHCPKARRWPSRSQPDGRRRVEYAGAVKADVGRDGGDVDGPHLQRSRAASAFS